ncbi:hypothetical protein [uncultured Succiniclasticum sp.]|uniref:hypothetical protein n=1 Tax=uncultured Succiniclasticum sp. TaxID=1500547 RepID=UPI0025D6DC43|nr:hypothetical protein [uncultured Succiniclasticum sp.]
MKEIEIGKVKVQLQDDKTPVIICTPDGGNMHALVNGPKGLLKQSVFMLLMELFKDDKPAFATALELSAGFDSIQGEFGPDIRIDVIYKGKKFDDYKPDEEEIAQCVKELFEMMFNRVTDSVKKAEDKDAKKD